MPQLVITHPSHEERRVELIGEDLANPDLGSCQLRLAPDMRRTAIRGQTTDLIVF